MDHEKKGSVSKEPLLSCQSSYSNNHSSSSSSFRTLFIDLNVDLMNSITNIQGSITNASQISSGSKQISCSKIFHFLFQICLVPHAKLGNGN